MERGCTNMSVDAKVFKDKIMALLDHLYESQKDVMEETAQLMARCIENDGVVHVFGADEDDDTISVAAEAEGVIVIV